MAKSSLTPHVLQKNVTDDFINEFIYVDNTEF